MKSVILSADAIRASPYDDNIYLAGGFESMTNAPHYIFHRGEQNKKLGHLNVLDATIHDGLWDVYNDQHMVGRNSANLENGTVSFIQLTGSRNPCFITY